MNFSMLDKIERLDEGFVATVVETEGHTYKKRGAKALFRPGDAIPLHGNLGSLCADQEIVDKGGDACRDGLPRVVRIDTTSVDDADLGYGTYCGGVMEVLIEPISDEHRGVYRAVRAALERGEPVRLVHDTKSGRVSIEAPGGRAAIREEGLYVETFEAPQRVYLFGATPLARRIARVLEDSEFDAHVVDWRSAYLEACDGVDAARRHLDELPFDERSYVVIVSHSFRRDKEALRAALEAGCPFVGMMSSRPRRDRMYEELREEGVGDDTLGRVRSPVGIDVGGSTDTEIAVGIVAEIVRFKHA